LTVETAVLISLRLRGQRSFSLAVW